MSEAFALLDDCTATPSVPSSRLFTGFVREHQCCDPQGLQALCAAAQADLRRGLHAVLLADYEWGTRLLGVQAQGAQEDEHEHRGKLRILMFDNCERLSKAAVDQWLATRPAREDGPIGEAVGLFGWKDDVDDQQFAADVDRIQQLIAAGQTYQINYTYQMRGWALGDPARLYRMLRQRQPAPYGALVRLPSEGDPQYILSLSPELFLAFDGQRLSARPMKGTAAAPQRDDELEAAVHALASDPKNRAENVMIVDLLRSDLGRIAKLGSVRVPRLFEVARHGSVLQMTSDVQAEPANGVSLEDALRAAFPCGSITGAPKKRAVELIAQIERSPRGLYTGAIGWLESPAPGACLGPFCVSVAIRTLLLDRQSHGLRPARFGVGAGIVADSHTAAERAECRLKSDFVRRADAGFELLETMYVADGAVPLLLRHIRRLQDSARALGFACNAQAIAAQIQDKARVIRRGQWRMRLCLRSDGRFELSSASLDRVSQAPQTLLLSTLPSALPTRLSRHKTTLRQHYDQGVQQAMAAGAFDTLFVTGDRRVVEGGRSNILARIGGRWCTPCASDGALPGVMRSLLLSQRALAVCERTICVDELAQADAVIACNALRGVVGIAAVGQIRYATALPAAPVPSVLARCGANEAGDWLVRAN